MDYRNYICPPTRENMGGVFAISTTVSDEQDTTLSAGQSSICFMTSVSDTYLLFDELATMTDIVVADYAGDERCAGPFVPGIVYVMPVEPRSRYFTVITEANTGRFCWWYDAR